MGFHIFESITPPSPTYNGETQGKCFTKAYFSWLGKFLSSKDDGQNSTKTPIETPQGCR